jgi:hypothetical protein
MARPTTLRLVRSASLQLRQLQLGRPKSPQWVRPTMQFHQLQLACPMPAQPVHPMPLLLARPTTSQLRQLHWALIDPVIVLEAGVVALRMQRVGVLSQIPPELSVCTPIPYSH